jgi:hypothetical protein
VGSLKTDSQSVAPHRSTPQQSQSSQPSQDLSNVRLPSLQTELSSQTFVALNDDSKVAQHFYPHIKVHTQYGDDITQIRQSTIPYASPEYRLRSDSLAQTLHIFAQKVKDILPPDYSVHVSLSPFGGSASCDTIHLLQKTDSGEGRPILQRIYSPFDGGSIGGIIPSDQARNVVLKIEERLFYYTTFLAIKKAVETSGAG